MVQLESLENRVYLSAKAMLPSGKPSSDDYGNTFDAAAVVVVDSNWSGSQSGRIEVVGDVDMFRFTSPISGGLTVNVSATLSRGVVDPYLSLFDGSYASLAQDNDSGGGTAAQCTIDVVSGQTYYLSVSGYGGSTGGYNVTLAESLSPATPMPSFLPGPDAYAATPNVSGQVVDTAGGAILVITGTAGADSLTLRQIGASIAVDVATRTLYSLDSGAFAGIAVYTFGAADMIRVDYSLSAATPIVIYAGAGADTVYQNSRAQGFIYGQDGDDLLVSVGSHADVVYGGSGLDSIWIDSNDSCDDLESVERSALMMHVVNAFATVAGTTASMDIAGQDMVDPAAAVPYSDKFVQRLKGDANADGIASFSDYLTLEQNFGRSGGLAQGDFDGNGMVNFSDYLVLETNFGKVSPPQTLFVDGPQYNDIRQGQVGDCYFMAGLSAMSLTDPQYIRQAITPLGDGTFAVRFFRGSTSMYYRIDAQLPVSGNSLYYAGLTTSDQELWVALVEKAFAQFRADDNSYASLSSGYMSEGFSAITGSYSTYSSTSSYTSTGLATEILNELQAGHPVCAASAGEVAPIVGSHAYAVKSVEFVDSVYYITVYNPWGFDGRSWDTNGSDGLLRLTADQFKACFDGIQVLSL